LFSSNSSAKKKSSDYLPRSSNPLIIRLLEAEPIFLKILKANTIYPRRKLIFNANKPPFQEIFRQQEDSNTELPYRTYKLLSYSPATIYFTAMLFTLDTTFIPHYAALAALSLGGYLFDQKARLEKKKMVRHILIDKNYQNMMVGLDNLGRIEPQKSTSLPEGVKIESNLRYYKFPLKHLLFFGYRQTYLRVKKGMRLENAESEAKVAMAEQLNLAEEVLKTLLNKSKFSLVLVFYDQESNNYIEADLDPNSNSLPEMEDYIKCLVDKTQMKFFSQ